MKKKRKIMTIKMNKKFKIFFDMGKDNKNENKKDYIMTIEYK